MGVEPLPGGLGNGGRVVRVGATVRRPHGPHSSAIFELLAHLERRAFPAPLLVETAPGEDVFRWIDGEVAVPPYPAWSLSDDALASVGGLLRSYHDAVCEFRPPNHARWSSELRDPHGGSIICHNDVCPENVVFNSGAAVALLDFDLAAPGRAVWDLASAARMWVPVRVPLGGNERDQLDRPRRLRVLADAYGLPQSDREQLVEAIIEGKRMGIEFVRRRVLAGETAFVQMWERQGGADGEQRAMEWLYDQRVRLLKALAARPASNKP